MYWKIAHLFLYRPAWMVASLLLLSGPAWAQITDSTNLDTTQVKQLEAITVTAERPRAVAPPVTTIEVSAAELRRTFANDAYDLLRRTSGIEVHEQGQGPGFASDAVIRGFSSDHSSDVLLVMDGVPINLPVHGHVEGYSDWSILSPAGISSLRVITGPASPLYGDFSLAGVVEAFTAADAAGTSASVSGSSYGDAGGWLRGGARGEQRVGSSFPTDGRGSLAAGRGRAERPGAMGRVDGQVVWKCEDPLVDPLPQRSGQVLGLLGVDQVGTSDRVDQQRPAREQGHW